MKLAALLLALCAACHLDAWDSPRPLETPQQGQPCGAAWHPCLSADDAHPTGACCPNTQACLPGGAECETVGGQRTKARRPSP